MSLKNAKWLWMVIVLLALFLPLGCKKASRDAKPPPLFVMMWGAGHEQVKETMGAEAEIVSDKPNFLVYKKIADGYPFYVTYEFENNRLIRLFLNVNVKNTDKGQHATLGAYLEAMPLKQLGKSRYVRADNLLYLNGATLCEMQVVSAFGGSKAKISLYDANLPQNAAFVANFEKAWGDGRWPTGETE